MNRHCAIILFLLCAPWSAVAQSVIFDRLAENAPGKGQVAIHQPASVRQLAGSLPPDAQIEEENDKRYLIMQGFRVQLYSGNNQRQSKDEALAKEAQLHRVFPDIPTYISYTAPFWRLRVGDFASYEEAMFMKYKLSDAFPTFRTEMIVSREDIRIPLD